MNVSQLRVHFPGIIIFVWFMAVLLNFVAQRHFPYIFDDEYGVLGSAAVLAGLDWEAPKMPYYGFGFSLFIAPLYFLSLSPDALYQSALVINSVLLASAAVLTYYTTGLLGSRHPKHLRMIVVVAAFSYPAVTHYAMQTMGETLLLFLVSAAIFLMAYLARRATPLAWACLGIVLALAPFAHTRGIALLIAAAPVLLYFVWNRRAEFKGTIIFIVTFLSSWIALSRVKGFLLERFYSNIKGEGGSVKVLLESRFGEADLEGLTQMILVAVGQLAYLLTSTFGLLGVGAATLVFLCIRSRPFARPPCGEFAEARFSVSVVYLLLAGAMFAASVIKMGGGSRADHVFYGRYNDVLVPGFIVSALLLLSAQASRFRRLAITGSGLALAVGVMGLVFLFPEEMLDRKMYWNPLTSWFVHIRGAWEIIPKDILIGSTLAGLLVAGVIYYSRRLAIILLGCFMMSAGAHNFSGQHAPADRGWSRYLELHKKYGSSLAEEQVIFLVGKGATHIHGEALQLALPLSRVKFESGAERGPHLVADASRNYCTPDTLVERTRDFDLCTENVLLRRTLRQAPTVKAPKSQKELHYPSISFGSNDDIRTIPIVSRGCAALAQYFYTSRASFCLPDVTLLVHWEAEQPPAGSSIGMFITDHDGRWVSEWRVRLPQQRSPEADKVTSPVRFSPRLPGGSYTLHAAIVSKNGWEWGTKSAVPFVIR